MKFENLKNKLIVILFTISSQVITSQVNMIPGYIIKLNGDTIRGFIDFQNWDINPAKITFKSHLEENGTNFNPYEINEFSVSNKIYQSGDIKYETSSNNIDDLSRKSELFLDTDRAFLEALVIGEKSLYLYKNKVNKKEQFYIKNDSTFEFLMYKKYLNVRPSEFYVGENKKYIGQLLYYFKDYPNIRSEIMKTKYVLRDLIALFNVFYIKKSPNFTFQKNNEKLSCKFGIFAGASLTSLNIYNYGNQTFNAEGQLTHSFDFNAGLLFDLVPARDSYKWSIHNELMFSPYNIIGNFNENLNNIRYNNYHFTFEYSYLKLNNLVRFWFPISKINMFLNIGLSNGFILQGKNYFRKESIIYGSSTIEENNTLEESKKYELGYLLGCGLKFNKKYSLEYRFELGNRMNDYKLLNSSANRNFIIFSYYF